MIMNQMKSIVISINSVFSELKKVITFKGIGFRVLGIVLQKNLSIKYHLL